MFYSGQEMILLMRLDRELNTIDKTRCSCSELNQSKEAGRKEIIRLKTVGVNLVHYRQSSTDKQIISWLTRPHR